MPQIKFEKEKLDALLVEVGNELAEMVKAESELAKSATDDAPAEESEGSSGPTEPDGDTGGEAPMGGAPEAAPPEATAAPEAPPSPEQSGAPAPDAAPGAEQAIEPAPTVEELQAEYSKLDPEALKMHYLACKSALMMIMGADQGAGPEASAPAAPPAAPPMAPEASPAAPPPAMKAEMKIGKAKDAPLGTADSNGGEVKEGGSMKIVKSEKDVEIESLRKQLDAQNDALLKLAEIVAKPIRKSVKGVSDLKFVERTEEPKAPVAATLTKAEINQKLRDKVREGKLSKSDKDLVSKYMAKAVDITKIEHLLADAK